MSFSVFLSAACVKSALFCGIRVVKLMELLSRGRGREAMTVGVAAMARGRTGVRNFVDIKKKKKNARIDCQPKEFLTAHGLRRNPARSCVLPIFLPILPMPDDDLDRTSTINRVRSLFFVSPSRIILFYMNLRF